MRYETQTITTPHVPAISSRIFPAISIHPFFVNVAKEIGNGTDFLSREDHPSIKAIRAYVTLPEGKFEGKVSKYLDWIGLRKAAGLDSVPSKILRLTKTVFIRPITNFVNRMINECKLPDPFKYAHVTPIFKKKNIT